IQRLGAEGSIEIDGGLVPVQDRPLETAAAALLGELRQAREDRLADALAAQLGLYKQIFEIDSGTGEKGRIVVEKQRKACRLPVELGNQCFSIGVLAEQCIPEA